MEIQSRVDYPVLVALAYSKSSGWLTGKIWLYSLLYDLTVLSSLLVFSKYIYGNTYFIGIYLGSLSKFTVKNSHVQHVVAEMQKLEMQLEFKNLVYVYKFSKNYQ